MPSDNSSAPFAASVPDSPEGGSSGQPRASELWREAGALSVTREYVEVVVAVGLVTLAAWFIPVDYRVFGDIYLLTVIALCLRVGPWPTVFAAIISALAWNFFIIPPRMSFSRIDFKDGVLLGAYFVVALVAGQLTARIRAQEIRQRMRKKRATALLDLTRALGTATTFDEIVKTALAHAHVLFSGRAFILVTTEQGPVGRTLGEDATDIERAAAERAFRDQRITFSENATRPATPTWHVPMAPDDAVIGVLSLRRDAGQPPATAEQIEMFETFAAHVGRALEREQFRSAREREKLLAESERLHRTLLDSVSHELKTPLAVLRAATENLTRQAEPRQAVLVDEIDAATRRLDRLVSNLLNQSRIESGRLKPSLDWCDPRDFVGAARKIVGEALAGHPLEVAFPDDLPLVMADQPLMEHVVANLLFNAALHTPPATRISIDGGFDSEANEVLIRVADHGPGIPEAERAGLFQKFHRGARVTTKGLGLGLSIVRGFMLAQGGDVRLDETPGGGARFTLRLPHRAHAKVPQE